MTRSQRLSHGRTQLIALLCANAISQLGSMCTLVALPWFVLQTTGSPSKAGITLAVDGVPTFFAGLFGGVLVDRVGYKPTSVVADLLSALSMGAIPLIYLTTGIQFWQLLALVFVGSLVDQTGRTARTSLIPELAESSGMSLVRANSLTQAIRRAALLFGPPMAGVLIAFAGASRVIWVDAFSYLISALLVGVGVAGSLSVRETDDTPILADTLDGVRHLVRDKLLFSIAAVASVGSLIAEPLYTVVYPVYAREVYHNAVTLGFMFSALAFGSLAGLGLYAIIGSRVPHRVTLLGGFAVQCASFWVLVTLPSLPILLGSIALNALCFEPINPLVSSLLQQRSPAAMRGRIIGTFNAIAIGTLPIGTMIGGFLLSGVGLVPTLLIISSASTALVLAMFAVPAFREIPTLVPSTS